MSYFSFIIVTCIFLYLSHYVYQMMYSHIELINNYQSTVQFVDFVDKVDMNSDVVECNRIETVGDDGSIHAVGTDTDANAATGSTSIMNLPCEE